MPSAADNSHAVLAQPFTVPALPVGNATRVRHLVFVLGDQLDRHASAFDEFAAQDDAVFMAEVAAESEYVWSAKQRIAVFLSAMRHFAQRLADESIRIFYTRLDSAGNSQDLLQELERAVQCLRPRRVIVCQPGEWRLLQALREFKTVPLDLRDERHFLCTAAQFERHARSRKQLRMEYFYREMRQLHNVLLDEGQPTGAAWNFDAQNRRAFTARGPEAVPQRPRSPRDAITTAVLNLVAERFPDHPGSLAEFDWPLTRDAALQACTDFVRQRLASFGTYQDAMWTDQPWLFHSHLSVALNLKLLQPGETVAAAEAAYRRGEAPLAAVEGFIRQILGWREYVRGIYWREMPGYLERNGLHAQQPLSQFYWHGEVRMHCLRQVIQQTLRLGYAHHIQRLMVTGLYALLLGVRPREVHQWYLAVYVDAVEWVELPNTLGMSQYADAGLMASKPYVATGRYIARMSNYCKTCPFNPEAAVGDDACPFTTLYWDFLQQHATVLAGNQRMAMQLKNLARLAPAQKQAISQRAAMLRNKDGLPGEA